MAGETETQGGLRERKKLKTRQTIASVALQLFVRNGFQQTTIAQIAEAADVSPRTVSTYFPAKEEIVFELSGDAKARLSSAILNRERGATTMEALRTWIVDERETWQAHEQEMVCQRQVIDADEGLRAHERALLAEFEGILAEGFAIDLETEPDALGPRMAAAGAVAVFDLLSAERDSKEARVASIDEQLDVLDQALAFITGGVTALREVSPGLSV